MRAEMYELHEAHEETHWWFAARRSIVLHMLRRELESTHGTRTPLRLLDVGCGAGGLLAYLREFGEVTGVDPSAAAVAYASAKGADVRAGTLPEGLPFAAEERFDVITLLDVLEHVEQDEAALAALARLLRPDGLLVVTVPAFPFLWSSHDVVNEHVRRYTRGQLRARLEGAGFDVRTISYYNTTLFLPIAAVRVVRRWLFGLSEQGDLGTVPRPVNAALRSLFAVERHVIGRLPLPFGVSLIATARQRRGKGMG